MYEGGGGWQHLPPLQRSRLAPLTPSRTVAGSQGSARLCGVEAAVRAPLLSNCSFLTAKITREEKQDTWHIFQAENCQGEAFALCFEEAIADSTANYPITEVSGEVFLCTCWGREKSPLPGFGRVVRRALGVVACLALFMISVMSPPCIQGLGSLGEGRQPQAAGWECCGTMQAQGIQVLALGQGQLLFQGL